MSQTIRVLRIIIAIAFIAVAFSCSEPNSDSVYFADTGHLKGWINDHGKFFLNGNDTCRECHGLDLRGGISDVSCFSSGFEGISCHAGGPPGHPLPFDNPDDHGGLAKSRPGSTSGFRYCKTCHGSDFSGGISQISCFTCHGVDAPHSPQPWRNGRTHTNTHVENAAVCADCHRTGQGTPGCFNNTLCHGSVNPHPDGWLDPDVHGPVAKAAPGNMSGFSYCQVCHGTRFDGGVTNTSCYVCHNVSAPHSPSPWRGGRTHTNTNTQNAPVCYICHKTGNSGPPSCFNNTLCHGNED